jgi:hypothetical protein
VANPTTNYGFVMPTPTDLVTDLPADFGVFGQAVDTQMKTNADAATQKATLTTKGDIYAATGTSTPARLAVGANDTVLTADSTTATGLKWATSSAGGMTLLSTTTISTATTTVSSISQSYKHLFITIEDLDDSGGTATVELQLNTTTTNNYYWGNLSYTGASTSEQTGIYSKIRMANIVAATNATATINIPEYTSAKQHNVYGNATWNNGDYCTTFNGYFNVANAITSISILRPAGETSYNGTLRIYGVS